VKGRPDTTHASLLGTSDPTSFFIMNEDQFDQFVDQMVDNEQDESDLDLGAFQDYHDHMLKLALEGPGSSFDLD